MKALSKESQDGINYVLDLQFLLVGAATYGRVMSDVCPKELPNNVARLSRLFDDKSESARRELKSMWDTLPAVTQAVMSKENQRNNELLIGLLCASLNAVTSYIRPLLTETAGCLKTSLAINKAIAARASSDLLTKNFMLLFYVRDLLSANPIDKTAERLLQTPAAVCFERQAQNAHDLTMNSVASLMNLVSVEKLDKPIRSKVFSPILALTVSTMFIYEIYLKYFHEPDESYFDVLDKFAKGEIRRTLDRYADECAEVNSVIEKRVELYKGKVDDSIDDDIYN